MPRTAIARSCFRGLRKALHTHFRDESIRKGYEDARDLIADLFGTQPDVPITQDSLAGFLNGFLLACTQFATIELINEQNDDMFPVIGGVYLLGAKAPLSCQPEQLDALKAGFFRRLTGPLRADLRPQPADVRQRNAAAEDAIRRILGTTPDVPVNRESLAGFVLGVMYSHRYLPTDGDGLTAIMVAACHLADRSDAEPIRSDGPGLW
jgi:hypothetical protein